MLYEISKELSSALSVVGCPLRVVYGPEPKTTGLTDSRIVIERDRKAGDQFTGPRSQQRNPKLIDVRAIGCVLRVYAQSTLAGASVYDHERIADQAIDQIDVAMRTIINTRKTMWRVTSAKLLSADELQLQGLTVWPGVVYEMKFQVDRGVLRTTWAGEAADEATMGGEGGVSLGSSMTVKIAGDPTVLGSMTTPSSTTRVEE
jgi:hypothetical protein